VDNEALSEHDLLLDSL